MNIVDPFAFGALWWFSYYAIVAIRVGIEHNPGGEK